MTNIIPLKSIYRANTVIGIGECTSTDKIPNNYLENPYIYIDGNQINLGDYYEITTSPTATMFSEGLVRLNDDLSSNSITLAATANTVNSVNNLVSNKLDVKGGTITGNLTVTGNLIVTGDVADLSATSLYIKDDFIEIHKAVMQNSANCGIQFILNESIDGDFKEKKTFGWNNILRKFYITNESEIEAIIATDKNDLSFFSNTTSANLKNIITGNTGSGNLVFSDSPIIQNGIKTDSTEFYVANTANKITLSNTIHFGSSTLFSNTVVLSSGTGTYTIDTFTGNSAQYWIEEKQNTTNKYNFTNIMAIKNENEFIQTTTGEIKSAEYNNKFNVIYDSSITKNVLQYNYLGTDPLSTNNVIIKYTRLSME